MTKLKGLGRGLEALLGAEEGSSGEMRKLQVSSLQPGKYQPRSRMDQDSLMHLAESIKAQGVMQPILVRPIDDAKYEIIAGERRWRASKLAGLQEVPVLIREVPDEAALSMALIENIQREDLNPLEQAIGIQRLVDEFGMTHQEAADAVGYSRSATSNLLRLLNLTQPVQDLLMHGKLDMGHARALLSLGNAEQIEIGNLIAKKQLSVREAERLVQSRLNGERQEKPVDRDVMRLQEEIAGLLGTGVVISHGKKGKGRITIEYSSLEHLDSILGRLH
ncbi:MAG TPA: ParB/RepB/Spo0J family partition protein [Burkholderiales bacterium]|nr:ParB/RepB/Spo0J family partition protein [Burkholderiales bacterium]